LQITGVAKPHKDEDAHPLVAEQFLHLCIA